MKTPLRLFLALLALSAAAYLALQPSTLHARVNGPVVTLGDGGGGPPPEPQK